MVPVKELLSLEIVSFIHKNRTLNISDVMLKMPSFSIDGKWIAAQIEGWQKATNKLPLWANMDFVIYPVRLSMEQCSSEKTASYKSSIVNGNTMVDLTGGFGVDTFFFAKRFRKAIYIEQQEDLTQIASHNFSVLGNSTIEIHCGNSVDILKTITEPIDLIYLDPARRKESQKVYKLNDCEPDVVSMLDHYFSFSNNILVKTSPMLDIKEAIRMLRSVKEVHIVSIDQECKEVLYILNKDYSDEPLYICVHDFKNKTDRFTFKTSEEMSCKPPIAEPLKFLYEPNASILKAGAFNSITRQFDVLKLHTSTHLYTSENLITNFPGRTFTIKEICGYNKKDLQLLIPSGKANIQTRNFPDSVEEIRKKTGIKDGGNLYVFATTLLNEKKVMLICEKA
jgi:16S rRNA G966 N2-methylase RsmD